MKKLLMIIIWGIQVCLSAQIIADHHCTDPRAIPAYWINQAKQSLHIAYGHTSHGSQVTDGMSGLMAFADNGGLGMSHPDGTFNWNNTGSEGALHLQDYAMDGDCGYYPQWVTNTTNYLGPVDANGRGSYHPDINVIIWSWCGQIDEKFAAGTLESEYIQPMNNLEQTYFNVRFVYMTGHVDHWDDANNKAANQFLRNYCLTNNKILFDFADIESWDPDAVNYQFPHDDCSYYASASGSMLGNWALEWQGSHLENTDWYNCGAAHSYPLNANRKAYAIWWLWARIAGWNGISSQLSSPLNSQLLMNYPLQSIAVSYSSDHPLSGITVTKTTNAPGIFGSLPANLSNLSGLYWTLCSSAGNIGSYSLTFDTTCLTDLIDIQRIHIFQRSTPYSEWVDVNTLPGITVNINAPFVTVTGLTSFSDFFLAEMIPTSGQDLSVTPYVSLKVYPNPFKEQTLFEIEKNTYDKGEIIIYNLQGRKVKSLAVNGSVSKIEWNGRNDQGGKLPSGIYFARLSNGSKQTIRKIILIK